MPIDYFGMGQSIGAGAANWGNRKKEDEKAKKQMELEERKVKMQEKALEREADQEAYSQMVNTKAQLGYSILNSEDPDAAWEEAKVTHPGLVTDKTSRMDIKDWIVGGVDAGVIGKDHIKGLQSVREAKMKSIEMNEANSLKLGQMEKADQYERGQMGYGDKIKSNQMAMANQYARGQEAQQFDNSMALKNRGGEIANNGYRNQQSLMDRRLGAEGGTPRAEGGTPRAEWATPGINSNIEDTYKPGTFGYYAKTASKKDANPMLSMTADVMGYGGDVNSLKMKDVASVYKEAKDVAEESDSDLSVDGPDIIQNVLKSREAKKKRTLAKKKMAVDRGKAIRVLHKSSSVSPKEAGLAFDMVAEQTFKEGSDPNVNELIQKTMDYLATRDQKASERAPKYRIGMTGSLEKY